MCRRSIFQCEAFLGRQRRAKYGRKTLIQRPESSTETNNWQLDWKVVKRQNPPTSAVGVGHGRAELELWRGSLSLALQVRQASPARCPQTIKRGATGTCLLSLSHSPLHTADSAKRQGSTNAYPCAKVAKKVDLISPALTLHRHTYSGKLWKLDCEPVTGISGECGK